MSSPRQLAARMLRWLRKMRSLRYPDRVTAVCHAHLLIHLALAARVHVNPRTCSFRNLVGLIDEGGRAFEGKADLMQRLMKLDELIEHWSGGMPDPTIEEHIRGSAQLFRRVLHIPRLVE